MIYYRFIPNSDILKEEDYIRGFGLDSTHYNSVRIAREKHKNLPQRKDFSKTWDKRSGYYITGEKIKNKKHPYHNLLLWDSKKSRYIVVDSVVKHHESGFVLKLIVREKESKSHAVLYWENISCHDPQILKTIEEFRKRYKK